MIIEVKIVKNPPPGALICNFRAILADFLRFSWILSLNLSDVSFQILSDHNFIEMPHFPALYGKLLHFLAFSGQITAQCRILMLHFIWCYIYLSISLHISISIFISLHILNLSIFQSQFNDAQFVKHIIALVVIYDATCCLWWI